MSLTNAERQKRYRERRKQQQPAVRYRRPKDRRSRPQRWADALDELRQLQEDYQVWLDNLPESLEGSILQEKLIDLMGTSVRYKATTTYSGIPR